ncbi:MAG: 4-hydroxyphenylpyruvate dioxygenase, partial [Nitrospirae bacterium]|nr:4-hydroxyphenylpyruvate dioxygenase [Fimbriimonadaceae bacterium]
MADTFPIRRVDHVRFLVGNARQAAYYYHKVFGFDIVGYHGLETGLKHEVDWLLEQGNTRFL